MTQRHRLAVLGMLLILVWTEAALTGESTARSVRRAGVLHVHCGDVAKSLDLELAIVKPARLITFCAKGDQAYCVPVRLTADNHLHIGDHLYVLADAISRALRCELEVSGGGVTVRRRAEEVLPGELERVPPYNATWGTGRGFGMGDTLPDIPLVDLQGNEVRFSQFLGKRYILYCWASW